MSFPGHVTNYKVVDNGLIYLNMDFQPNPWRIFGEKSEKPQFLIQQDTLHGPRNGQKPSEMAIFDKI